MAERTTILRVLVGSEAYGTALKDESTGATLADRDERGVCVEDYEAFNSVFGEFQQHEWRSATERTGEKDAKSEPGDLDLVVYSLKKFVKLALQGNPNIIEMLFIKGDHTLHWERLGTELQDLYPHIVSKCAGPRYLGFMKGQINRYLKGDNSRVHLIEKFGFDTKCASHVIRLGLQCVELLKTGKLILPVPSATAGPLMDIKRGKWKLPEINEAYEALEAQIKGLMQTSELRELPDFPRVQKWMQDAYWSTWSLNKMNAKFQEVGVSTLVH